MLSIRPSRFNSFNLKFLLPIAKHEILVLLLK